MKEEKDLNAPRSN